MRSLLGQKSVVAKQELRRKLEAEDVDKAE